MNRALSRGRKMLLLVAVLAVGTLGFHPAPAFPPSGPPDLHGGPTNFFTVSDGTSIALNVVVPDKCDPAKGGTDACPAILEMAGYENGSSDASGRTTLGQFEDWCKANFDPRCEGFPLTGDSHEGTSAYRYDADYVLVHASVRGTGCSSGEFDLFSERSAMDGYEIIENYIVDNSKHATASDTQLSTFKSNGKVGILGHSYSGETGFMIAAQEGKAARDNNAATTSHLTAVTVSGLIDDLYRGITYPGGVANVLFPPEWTLGVRPAYDVLGGQLQGVVRNADEHPEISAQCAQNIATHTRNVVEDPVLNGTRDTDSNWWRSRSLVTYAPFIAAPIHTAGAFQDEQTGPRFAHLWETIPNDVPKRLLMSNGNHGTQVSPKLMWDDRKAWMDFWMRGIADPYVKAPGTMQRSVRTLLELHGEDVTGIKDSANFPLEDTTWTPYYLCAGADGNVVPGMLSATGCSASDNATSAKYLSGSKRQSWFFETGGSGGSPMTTKKGPDELDFVAPAFTDTTVIDGPITANLFMSTTAPDTEVFVQVADRNIATGELMMLQRGMLRASHRAIDATRSDYAGSFMYRPFRPHTNAELLTPGQTYELLVEIFPVAHIFRPGHALQIKIMAPPAVDSYYSYAPKGPPAINTVYFGSEPSRITIPIIPTPALADDVPACSEITQYRCVTD
ncbi:MAG: CocE/NonD family hydrolase [Actinomycetota bacterium]|nr:CocE/NonD family hydrolase [Actinomycetota bacterium]